MSENSKILEKYEQMFKDGSAYQPIHLNQPTPDLTSITGEVEEKTNIPLGQQVEKDVFMEDQHTDYSEFDATMQQKINEVRSKTQGNNPNVSVQNDEFKKLTRRVELLEQALQLVMETQTKLLKERNEVTQTD